MSEKMVANFCGPSGFAAQEVGATVLINVVYIREPHACFAQTISDRLRRKS
jgi:hypothetical protein